MQETQTSTFGAAIDGSRGTMMLRTGFALPGPMKVEVTGYGDDYVIVDKWDVEGDTRVIPVSSILWYRYADEED